MSIIINGITKEEFARRMWGEGIEKVNPDIIGSCDSYYGYKVEQLPPHGRLIDADALEKEACDVVEDRGWYSQFGYSLAQIQNAPTIIEAEEKEKCRSARLRLCTNDTDAMTGKSAVIASTSSVAGEPPRTGNARPTEIRGQKLRTGR